MMGRRFFATIGKQVAEKKAANNAGKKEEVKKPDFSDEPYHVPTSFQSDMFANKTDKKVEVEEVKENVKYGPSISQIKR